MNLTYISEHFNTHIKCIQHIEKVRWQNKPICPHCNSDKITARDGMPRKSKAGRKRVHPEKPYKTPRYHCNACNKDFTVLMGTIFEGSKMPLPKWFMLISLMVHAKKGISAKQISRDLDVTYKTAWFSAMRVRCAMLDQATMLHGIIESDAMYVGGKPRHRYSGAENEANLSTVSKRGKGSKKVPVVGFVEREHLKRIVVKMFNGNPTSAELMKMLKKHVKESDAILMTDEAKEYKPLGKEVQHLSVNHSQGEYVKGKGANAIHTNTIEGFWAHFKNGLRGNYHALSKKYLPFYLAEFAFKYNTRNNTHSTFMETVYNAVNDPKCAVNYKPKKYPRYLAYGPKKKKKPCGKEHECV
jgi:transposase-like protein